MNTDKQTAIENGLQIGAKVECCAGTCDHRISTVVVINDEGYAYDNDPSFIFPFSWWSGDVIDWHLIQQLMKTLTYFKSAYAKAKTSTGRTAAFNKAYLNLTEPDFKLFLKWQVSLWSNQQKHMEKLFYIVSLKHTSKADAALTLWGRDHSGYVWCQTRAGVYTQQEADKLRSDDNFPVEKEKADAYFMPGNDFADKFIALPNNVFVRKALGLTTAHMKDAVYKSCKIQFEKQQ